MLMTMAVINDETIKQMSCHLLPSPVLGKPPNRDELSLVVFNSKQFLTREFASKIYIFELAVCILCKIICRD